MTVETLLTLVLFAVSVFDALGWGFLALGAAVSWPFRCLARLCFRAAHALTFGRAPR